jgi:hypothetical protein
MKVEHEMYYYTGNTSSHPNSNKMFKEKFGSHPRKTFDRFRTKAAVLRTTHVMRAVQQSENSNVYSDRRISVETRGVSLAKFAANR